MNNRFKATLIILGINLIHAPTTIIHAPGCTIIRPAARVDVDYTPNERETEMYRASQLMGPHSCLGVDLAEKMRYGKPVNADEKAKIDDFYNRAMQLRAQIQAEYGTINQKSS